MNCRAWLSTGALLLALPAAALAQSPAERAAALFREGRTAMDRGDLAAACPRFAESARLDPAPGTVLNLALCEEGLGRVSRALAAFHTVIAMLPSNDERVPFAQQHADALGPRVALLRVVLPSTVPSGARLLRDGVEIARSVAATDNLVDPGVHKVTLRTPGHDDATVSITLGAGERRTLMWMPTPQRTDTDSADGRRLSGASRSGESTPGSPSAWRKPAGLIVGGAGAASLAIGLITGVLVLDKKATVDASCGGSSVCDSQPGVDAAAVGRALSRVSTVTFVAGAAALGLGVFLVLTSDDAGRATMLGPAGPRQGARIPEPLLMRRLGQAAAALSLLAAAALPSAGGCAELVDADFSDKTLRVQDGCKASYLPCWRQAWSRPTAQVR